MISRRAVEHGSAVITRSRYSQSTSQRTEQSRPYLGFGFYGAVRIRDFTNWFRPWWDSASGQNGVHFQFPREKGIFKIYIFCWATACAVRVAVSGLGRVLQCCWYMHACYPPHCSRNNEYKRIFVPRSVDSLLGVTPGPSQVTVYGIGGQSLQQQFRFGLRLTQIPQ